MRYHHRLARTAMRTATQVLLLFSFLPACDSSSASTERARQLFLGFDHSIDNSLQLALDGYNSSGGGGFSQQTINGLLMGTMNVAGTVNNLSSTQAQLRLTEELINYSDYGNYLFNTTGSRLLLSLNLEGIPNGTFDGSLVGMVTVSSAQDTLAQVNISLKGMLQPLGGKTVQRTPGATLIKGSFSAGSDTYAIDVQR